MHPNRDTPFTWESKLAALQEIGAATLRMCRPGVWYVDWYGIEIGGDGLLRSPVEEGKTPAAAVNNLFWRVTRDLPKGRHLRTASGRRVRWDSRNRKWKNAL